MTIHRFAALSFAITLLFAASYSLADDAIFSGPQVGEKLVGFKIRRLLGDDAAKEVDLVEKAEGKPIVLIFVNQVTRPSIGVSRAICNYSASRSKDGLHCGLIFLTDDATETEAWAKRASHALPANVPVGISVDGGEGPGAYGLNRNVAMTILVAKQGKVTANFALVQPSLQADAPKVAKAIVDCLGSGKVPTLAEMGVGAAARPATKPAEAMRKQDPQLRALLSPLINKSATPEQVDKAAADIEAYVKKNPATGLQIRDIARRIIAANKLENYGTPAAQAYLTRWAKGTDQVLRHAVFFGFKDSASKEDVDKVVAAFRALPSKIDVITDLQSGTNNSPEGLDDGYTHCFLLTFKDEAGRAEYLPHAEHKAFGNVLRPHMEKVFVVDYWGSPNAHAPKKQLKHAVFFKFKDDAAAEDVKAVEEAFAALPSKIDSIKAFEWGKNNSPEKHADGFTHCFMVTFDSEEGRAEYLPHPAHKAFVELLMPVLDKVRVLDFWAE